MRSNPLFMSCIVNKCTAFPVALFNKLTFVRTLLSVGRYIVCKLVLNKQKNQVVTKASASDDIIRHHLKKLKKNKQKVSKPIVMLDKLSLACEFFQILSHKGLPRTSKMPITGIIYIQDSADCPLGLVLLKCHFFHS